MHKQSSWEQATETGGPLVKIFLSIISLSHWDLIPGHKVESLGPDVLGFEVLGQVVTGAKFLGQSALGHEVIGTRSTGAEGSRASGHCG